MTTKKSKDDMKGKAKDFVGQVFSNTVVNPIIECIDVDGVARRIDVNAVVEKIDVNSLIDRIDINHVLDRVDLDRQLQRVDMNAVMERVDINDIVARSDIGAIVAHSTSGIFTHILDALRTQVVVLDSYLVRIPRILPPAPGDEEQDRALYPRGRTNKAIAVQGRYAGPVSKCLAMTLDAVLITVSFAVSLFIMEFAWNVLFGDSNLFMPGALSTKKVVDRDHFLVAALYAVFWFLYFFLSVALAGQTLGMLIIGLKVVSKAGSEVSTTQAAIRTLFLPISTVLMPFLVLIGFFRRDGRMLHDLVAGTGVVYHSNARMAKLRERAMARMEQVPLQYSESEAEDVDDSGVLRHSNASKKQM